MPPAKQASSPTKFLDKTSTPTGKATTKLNEGINKTTAPPSRTANSPVKSDGKSSPVKLDGKNSPVKSEGKNSPAKSDGKSSPVKLDGKVTVRPSNESSAIASPTISLVKSEIVAAKTVTVPAEAVKPAAKNEQTKQDNKLASTNSFPVKNGSVKPEKTIETATVTLKGTNNDSRSTSKRGSTSSSSPQVCCDSILM